MVLHNILLSAIFVGTLSGLIYSLFQQLHISPIIYAAEVYEVDAPETETHAAESSTHSHTSTTPHASIEEAEAWSPSDGFERIFYTVSADIFIAIAFSMVMIALMAMHNAKSSKTKINARLGIIWGGAALLSVFIAPALFGLHPEIPGTEAAILEDRQAWWLFCALASAGGLAVLYYANHFFKLIGLGLLLAPHIIGAPMPVAHGFANPDPLAVAALAELSQDFYLMTAVGMTLFFLLIGSLSGHLVQRYIRL